VSTPNPPDPFTALKQAYDDAAQAWGQTVEQMVGTEEFAAASGQFLKRYVEMQAAVRKSSTAAADSLHLTTKDDVARVAQLVVNVERKVDEVTDELHALVGRLAQLPDAQALSGFGERLTSIEASLERLAAGPSVSRVKDEAAPRAEEKGARTGARASTRRTRSPRTTEGSQS
jgi:polyhydroxyalkanoic acid synthase PhaR subunit